MTRSEEARQLIEKRMAMGNFRQDLLDLVPMDCPAVLEFGYGDGTSLLAAQIMKNARKVYGIDIAEKPVARFFDKAWHFDLSLPDTQLDEELDNSVECIISSCAMEHVYDPWRVLSKLRRCLTDTGAIHIEIPNVQCWESLYRIAAGEFPYTSGAHFDCTHIRWYTLHSFIEILEYVGFEPQSVEPLLFGVDLSFLDKVKEMRTVELPPPGVNSDAPKIIIKYPVDIKPLYPFFVAPRFIFTATKGAAPLEERSTWSRGEFEEYRLKHPSQRRVIPKFTPDPLHPYIAGLIKERTGIDARPEL